MEYKDGYRRKLEEIPFDMTFDLYDGSGRELCHATGYEVFDNGEWWNEYMDSTGETHFGR